jgi:hypothetical protein
MEKLYHIDWPWSLERYKEHPKSLYNTHTFGDYTKLSPLEQLQYVYGEVQREAGVYEGVAHKEAVDQIVRVSQMRDVKAFPEFLAYEHELVQLAAKLRLVYLKSGWITRWLNHKRARLRILLSDLKIDKRDKRYCIRALDLHCMLLLGRKKD